MFMSSGGERKLVVRDHDMVPLSVRSHYYYITRPINTYAEAIVLKTSDNNVDNTKQQTLEWKKTKFSSLH